MVPATLRMTGTSVHDGTTGPSHLALSPWDPQVPLRVSDLMIPSPYP
jgi:hypothetical protein